MTLSITELDASTEERLQQALASLLAHAQEEVLTTLKCRNSGGFTKRFSDVARALGLPRSWLFAGV